MTSDPVKEIGLCAACRHCRSVQSTRSTFYLCELSLVDARFRKYPPLPVFRCLGYQPDDGNPPVDGGQSPLRG